MIKFESGSPASDGGTSTYAGPVITDISLVSPYSVASTSFADTGLQHSVTTTRVDEVVDFSMSGYQTEDSHLPHTIVLALKVGSGSDAICAGTTIEGDFIGYANFSRSIKFATPGTYVVKLRAKAMEALSNFTIPTFCVFQMKQY